MPLPTIFPVCFSPETVLEVAAQTVGEAINAALAALPHVRPAEDERASAVNVGGDVWYTLTCLLCDATNPHVDDQLVSVQEHQMEEHGLDSRAFQQEIRVFIPTSAVASQYIWVLPQSDQTALACTRASRYTTAERAIPIKEPLSVFTPGALPSHVRTQNTSVFLVTDKSSAREARQEVKLSGEDSIAWYGFAADGEPKDRCLIWPKTAWRIA